MYIYAVVAVVEVGLILYSYSLLKSLIPTPRLWAVSHCLLVVGLGIIIFVPYALLGIIFGTIFIGFGIIVDGYNHYGEYNEHQKIKSLRDLTNQRV